MSHWNYRILERKDEVRANPEPWYEVVEVYYNDDGSLMGWTPSSAMDDTPEGIASVLEMMADATTKPVLRESEFQSGQPANPT